MGLLSWMNGVKTNSGVRMLHTRSWDPPLHQSSHSRPIQVTPLAATNQNLPPQPSHPPAEYAEAIGVARHRVIVEVASHDRLEPLPGFGHRCVHTLTELLLNVCQLPPHALADRVTLHREVSLPVFPADMREPQEIQRFRLSFFSLFPALFGKSPELNPARFVWMKLQPELLQPPLEFHQEAVCIGPVLEPDYIVVSVPDDNHIALRAFLAPGVHP